MPSPLSFIPPTPAHPRLSLSVPSSGGCLRCGLAGPRPSRRGVLRGLAGLAGLAALSALPAPPVRGAEPPPGLPDGARQFNNLRTAREQWAAVGGVLDRDGVVGEEEWGNLRGFLRVFFKVGEDIEFLGKGLGGGGKERSKEIVKALRKSVKGMDKVATEEKREEFGRLHAEVLGLVDEFVDMLGVAKADVPQDL